MVKYGQCYIYCKQCGKGCGVETQIQRDKQWEYNVVTQSCPHYIIAIHMYTNNSFFPWTPEDKIRFEATYTPVGGGKQGYLKGERSSMNDGHENHDGGCSIEMHWTGNSFGDIVANLLEAAGGWVVGGVAGAIVAPIVMRSEYLTTVRF